MGETRSNWPPRTPRIRPATRPTPVAWPVRSDTHTDTVADSSAVVGGQDVFAVARRINAGLDERIHAADGDRARARVLIAEAVRAWAEQQAGSGRFLVAHADQARLVAAVEAERYGLGALQQFADDPDVEEIDVNGLDQVWVSYRDGHKAHGPAVAGSEEELVEKVRRWAGRGTTVREFSAARPLLNVALADGLVRMTATMAVSRHVHVSLRRHGLAAASLEDLATDCETFDHGLRVFLSAAVRARLDILITGGVKAGKTTLMRALCGEMDPDERIITLESERELFLDRLGDRHWDVVSLEERQPNAEGIGAVTLTDLVPHALRHHPDRILVGEVRQGEMLALLQAIDNGLEGSLSTLHANAGSEVFGRILTLCAYSDYRLPEAELYRLIGRAVDLVVHLRRDRLTGRRWISEVIEVLPPADSIEPGINRLYATDPDGRPRAVPTGTTPSRPTITALEGAGFDRRWLYPTPGWTGATDGRTS